MLKSISLFIFRFMNKSYDLFEIQYAFELSNFVSNRSIKLG